jgi:hypothetical protein
MGTIGVLSMWAGYGAYRLPTQLHSRFWAMTMDKLQQDPWYRIRNVWRKTSIPRAAKQGWGILQ